MIGGYPLLLFAGKVSVNHEQGTICVDGWIQFKAPVRVAVLFKVRPVRNDASRHLGVCTV